MIEKLYVVMVNTDLTEGRGTNVPIAYAYVKTTAKRLAKKQNVQGSDGVVEEVNLKIIDDKPYISIDYLKIERASKADEDRERVYRARERAMEKARDLGLTELEIDLIRGVDQ